MEPGDAHYAFDFYPVESPEQTRISPFFEHLRQGRLTTTKCLGCGRLLWQPRVVCDHCRSDRMEWVDLPSRGTIFAHTAVLAGAPVGFEKEVPFVVAVIQLDGVDLKVVARVDGARYEELAIGDPVALHPVTLPDGRVWFRFKPAR